MNQTQLLDPATFRRKAIDDLEKLKNRYLDMVHSDDGGETDQSNIQRFERAMRLLPGLLKTEENLLSSAEDAEQRRRLEESLEPLFTVLRKVLGSEFDSKREEILAALEAKLKNNGS